MKPGIPNLTENFLCVDLNPSQKKPATAEIMAAAITCRVNGKSVKAALSINDLSSVYPCEKNNTTHTVNTHINNPSPPPVIKPKTA
jgi:hypothetical protein